MSVCPASGIALAISAFLLAGCRLPGKPKPEDVVPRPDSVTSFDVLYGKHCAACHGADGQNGSATNLANPQFQALIDDARLREIIANGEKGTLMPGFGTNVGGDLTPLQIDALLDGIRSRWARGNTPANQHAPPYKAMHAGNPANGQQVYTDACARCHGVPGQKPGPAGSILDGSFLGLVSDQMIRTTIIAGRPDIGQPDWRNMIPGRPLSDDEVTDVTAWLISQRPVTPGQPYPDKTTTTPTSSGPEPNAVEKSHHP